MHIEGLNTFNDSKWPLLEAWYKMGWRSLGPVWNLTNTLGGGTKDPSSGLTPLGEKLISWLQGRNMIIDFAHMNEQTFWDAAKIVKGPILVSHGNTCRHCTSPRNYNDDQLRKVASSGGIVGIFFARTYVTGTDQGSIADVVRHVLHMRDVMGIDHIGLGTDFGGIVTGRIDALSSIDHISTFFEALAGAGLREEEIEKIAWKNAARVLKEILGRPHSSPHRS